MIFVFAFLKVSNRFYRIVAYSCIRRFKNGSEYILCFSIDVVMFALNSVRFTHMVLNIYLNDCLPFLVRQRVELFPFQCEVWVQFHFPCHHQILEISIMELQKMGDWAWFPVTSWKYLNR